MNFIEQTRKLIIIRKSIVLLCFFFVFLNKGHSQPPHNEWPKAGMNLEWQELMNWTESIPFNNLFKIADPFKGATSYDPQGYPLSGFPSTSVVYIGDNLPLGTYKLRWDGDGAFNLLVGNTEHPQKGQCPANGVNINISNKSVRVELEIISAKSNNHLRNMRFYLPGYDDSSPHQFNDCYLSLFKSPIDVIRPMWWARIPSSGIINWSDRPQIDDYSYGGDDDNTNNGTAYEHMIDIANLTQSDLWICVPVKADDNFVAQLATLIKNRLNDDLNVFVEYSNESTWNYWFEYHNDVDPSDVGLSGYNGDDGDIYVSHKYGARSAQILEIFDNVFKTESNRLIGILGGQFSYIAPLRDMVDAIEWMGKMELFDAFAIAPYVGEHDLITGRWPDMDAIFDTLESFAADLMAGDVSPGLADDKGDPMTDFIDLANKYDKKLVAYEAGQHFVSWSIGGVGGGLTPEQVRAINVHPRMYNFYQRYLDGWFSNSPVTSTMVFYTSTSSCPSGGSCFGTLTSCDQPIEDAHKYRGIIDWFNGNSQEDTEAPTPPSNLVASNVSSTGCLLQWDASSDNVGISQYLVFVQDSLIGTSTSTSFSVSGLTGTTSYTFHVIAKDAAGNVSSESNAVDVTTTSQPPLTDAWPRAGMNLEWQELMKWTRSIPFNNLFKVADPFSGATSYDPSGYPLTGLPASTQVYVGENLPIGTYKVRWDGDGTFNIRIGAKTYQYDDICPSEGEEITINDPSEIVSLEITSTNSRNHLRNMRMYLPGYDDSSPHQFNDCYLGLFESPIDVLRPMWWTMVPGSDIINWDDRPKLDDFSYGGDEEGVINHGTAYEHMIDLCNVSNSDLWICVPVMANDNYVNELAKLIKTRLNENLKVFVEYSNESTWNYWFEYHNDVDPSDVGLTGYNGDDGDIYVSHKYGARSAQILEIFDNVFKTESNRLIGILGGQFSYIAPLRDMVDAIEWMGKMELFDAFAIAPYVGEHDLITGRWPDMDAIFDTLESFAADLMAGDVSPGLANDKGDPMTDFIDLANKYDKKLVAYEAGQHFVSWSIGGVGGGLTPEQVRAINVHPRMYNFYQRYLDGWFSNSPVTSTMVFYTSTSSCPSGGSCFGTLTSCDQPIEDAHKYRGIIDWFNGNSQEDTEAPTPPSNLVASNVSSTGCLLQWDASSDNVGISQYLVFVQDSLIGTSASTSFSVSGLTGTTSYTFHVVAKDAAGNVSSESNAVDVTTTSQPPLTDAWPRAGMNLEWGELQKWTSSIPFNNLFKIADPFKGANSYDPAGYPLTGLPANSEVYNDGDNLPLGSYKVRWDGDGTFTISVDGKVYDYAGVCPDEGEEIDIDNPSAIVSLEITTTNSSNHLRNMRMYLPGYDDSSPHQFNDCYLDLFKAPIDVLRMVWWAMVPASDIVNWEDRPKIDDYSYGGDEDGVINHGTAYEHMIDICNASNSDLWICVPVKANDNFVVQLASLIKNRLKKNLKVFVEYSNESTWNYWTEYHINVDPADVGLDGYHGDDGDIHISHKFAARTVQIIDLFDNTFGAENNRIIGVLGCQFGYYPAMPYMIDAAQWMGKLDLIDAFAVAPYVGESGLITEKWPDMDAIFDTLDIYTTNLMNGSLVSDEIDYPITHIMDLAKTYNKKLLAYEGGQHFVTWSIGGVGGGLNEEQIEAVNSHPRMYDFYQNYLDKWFSNSPVASTMVLYSSTSPCPTAGGTCFGTLTSCDQPIEEAHKYRGIIDWFNATGGEDSEAPTAPSNLIADDINITECDLYWDASTDNVAVSQYQIFMSGSLIGTSTTASYHVSGLTKGKTYSFYVKAVDAAGNFSPKSNTIEVLGGTKKSLLSNNRLTNPLLVFPNPVTHGKLHIKVNNVDYSSIRLLSLNGGLIYSQEGFNSEYVIKTEGFSDGIYVLHLLNRGKVQTFKIVIGN